MRFHFTHAALGAIVALFLASTAASDMIPTEQIISPEQNIKYKQVVTTALQREEVKKLLLENGADPKLIEQRLDQLTDHELQLLANQFEQLPAAGGGDLSLILIGSGVVILILELTGVIDMTTAF
ncbi:MAG: PA2779 family protein [Pseudomonadota bacterium]